MFEFYFGFFIASLIFIIGFFLFRLVREDFYDQKDDPLACSFPDIKVGSRVIWRDGVHNDVLVFTYVDGVVVDSSTGSVLYVSLECCSDSVSVSQVSLVPSSYYKFYV